MRRHLQTMQMIPGHCKCIVHLWFVETSPHDKNSLSTASPVNALCPPVCTIHLYFFIHQCTLSHLPIFCCCCFNLVWLPVSFACVSVHAVLNHILSVDPYMHNVPHSFHHPFYKMRLCFCSCVPQPHFVSSPIHALCPTFCSSPLENVFHSPVFLFMRSTMFCQFTHTCTSSLNYALHSLHSIIIIICL